MGLLNRKKAEPDQLIDLRPSAPSTPRWGSPVPCPECHSRGYLDHIDPFREVMFLHCTACYAKYEVTRAELIAQGADTRDPAEAFTA